MKRLRLRPLIIKAHIRSFKEKLENLVLKKVKAEGMSTTELVNIIFSFCEMYCGVKYYPYQAQFGKRIIRSILDNDGLELTALFARQMGKLVY